MTGAGVDDRGALADVPPEEFIAARDELAKQLKADGKAAEAAEVKKLRKPTVTQWIADQVCRHSEAVDALRAASAAVAEAQEAAIVSGDRDALRDATAARRAAVDAVGRAVDDALARHGRPAHHRDNALNTIESDVTAEVASGTFGLRDDLELPERAQRQTARDRKAERRAEEAEAKAKAALDAAEDRVRRAREELERAESALQAVLERHGRPAGDS
jgi:hypothetical protein